MARRGRSGDGAGACAGRVGGGCECERVCGGLGVYHGHTLAYCSLPSFSPSQLDDALTHEGHGDCWQQGQEEELSYHCEGWRRRGSLCEHVIEEARVRFCRVSNHEGFPPCTARVSRWLAVVGWLQMRPTPCRVVVGWESAQDQAQL